MKIFYEMKMLEAKIDRSIERADQARQKIDQQLNKKEATDGKITKPTETNSYRDNR